MKSKLLSFSRTGLFGVLLSIGSSVLAATGAQEGPVVQAGSETLEMGDAAAASESELETARGRQGINLWTISQASDAQQDAQLNDNSISGVTTGDNVVESGAFRGAAGNSTIIQNSGNQVIIQDNTIYNITLVR